MSSLKLLHSGGNSVSLNPPSSAPSSSEVAFKLPNADGSASQVLKTDGSGNLSFTTITDTKGVEVADIWRINTGGTLSTDATTDFNSNWERADTYGSGQIGSGMTESSGVFTFPSTGIYLITAMMQFKRNSGDNRYANLDLKITTDGGSSYDVASTGAASFAQDYSTNTAVCNYIFDVTNVSTHKVFFSAYTNRSSVLFLANSTSNACSFTFIKLGDT
tara:strand:- start:400 stop:1053 length:654 start_codon:yes stop_codon:yes gene_type:complete